MKIDIAGLCIRNPKVKRNAGIQIKTEEKLEKMKAAVKYAWLVEHFSVIMDCLQKSKTSTLLTLMPLYPTTTLPSTIFFTTGSILLHGNLVICSIVDNSATFPL